MIRTAIALGVCCVANAYRHGNVGYQVSASRSESDQRDRDSSLSVFIFDFLSCWFGRYSDST
jgi:hypothetical protein